MKDFMNKIKKDKVKFQRFQANHAKAQEKFKRKQLQNEETAKKFREKRANYQKEYRAKKKAANVQINSSFSTKNALSKAVSRVMKSIPKDEKKSHEVLSQVIKKKKYITHRQQYVLRKRRESSEKKLAREFFNFDDISYQFPGKNDCIKIKNDSGQIVTVQKRQLLMSVDNCYKKFKILFPRSKICLRSFYNARPKNIISYDKIKQNFCTCTYCENMKLCFESIRPFMTENIDELRDVIVKLLCHRHNFECCQRTCKECGNADEKLNDIFIENSEDEPINMMTWGKNDQGYVQKLISPIKSVSDAKKWFLDNFDHYVMHKYIIKIQLERLRELKATLSDDTAYMTMDFSNNFQTMAQDEVQAAYFSRKYIEVFTCIVYVGQNEPLSFILTNDNASHSKEHVHFYIHKVLTVLKEKFPQLKKIHFVSDGAASQFKNRFTLAGLLFIKKDFKLNAVHEFTPSNHGKNAVDGLGGIVKRGVFKKVMTKKNEVYNSKQFIECAQTIFHSIIFFHTDDTEIDKMKKKVMTPRWEKILKNAAAPRNCHYFEPSEDEKYLKAFISSAQEKEKKIKIYA